MLAAQTVPLKLPLGTEVWLACFRGTEVSATPRAMLQPTESSAAPSRANPSLTGNDADHDGVPWHCLDATTDELRIIESSFKNWHQDRFLTICSSSCGTLLYCCHIPRTSSTMKANCLLSCLADCLPKVSPQSCLNTVLPDK